MAATAGSVRTPPSQVRGIVTDLDGTLLRSDGTFSQMMMRLLLAAPALGVTLLVATARTPRALRRITGHEHLGRVVCANGAVLWDSQRDQVRRERSFDPVALAVAVTRMRDALPDAGVALLSARTMFVDRTYMALRRKGADGAQIFSDLEHVVAQHRIVTAAVRHPGLTADQCLATVARACAGLGVASLAGRRVVDITPEAATKATAVAEEMAARNCPADSIVVFGDMPNDLPLFAWAGWAFAMANGHPDVMAAADEVAPRNDDDGVALTVQRLLGTPEVA